ncbi:MAG: hypothetical protein ACI8RZ_002407 [Myxococcota bacterium]|jgi:hypothetical protein
MAKRSTASGTECAVRRIGHRNHQRPPPGHAILYNMIPFLLTAPGPIQDVRLADYDGDGDREVIVTAQRSDGGLDLKIIDLDTDGRPRHSSLTLPAVAAWWDAGHGLWVLDSDGLRTLPGAQHIAVGQSPLGGIGPTTPVLAPLVTNLDHDGQVELVLWETGAVSVVGEDGVSWGRIGLQAAGVLSVESWSGGMVLQVATRPPPITTADFDGDGIDDFVVIRDDVLEIHFTQTGRLSASTARWPLPALLAPASAERSTADGFTTSAHWRDLTGDGRADLLIHRIASDGRLTGTEAELSLLTNTGRSLSAPQIIRTGAGSQDAFPIDLDGDGDLDVLIPQVVLAVGNLAQAILTRSVDVTLVAHMMQDARLGPAVPLFDVSLPLEGGKGAAWSLFEDIDGDGLPDLAVAVDGLLTCYRGQGTSVERAVMGTAALNAPVENLWAADLTGDGRAELIGWAPGARELVVVRSQ